MDDKNFVWNSELTKKFIKLRFENDWLFKKKKQAWREFHNILLENGFPEEMSVIHIRKKWAYTHDSYRIAKRTNNKTWKYYKLFENHFDKSKTLDKYGSWSDEWRLKLIKAIIEAKDLNLGFLKMWREVERTMRNLCLPNDCCVQDMKGLWHHIRTTFNRKHRLKLKREAEYCEWPLYDSMLSYYEIFDPEYLVKLETVSPCELQTTPRKASEFYSKKRAKEQQRDEFQWSKDITETFIQIRLQNDWLFRERKWAWHDFRAMMIDDYEFPKTLTSREICRKWASTYSEYQKAKATNNRAWVYYRIFEAYFGEGSLNPLVDWQDEWVFNLISVRTELDHLFRSVKDQSVGWREVEKKLRNMGIPLDHSLLEIPEIWKHLLKTYKWKLKFAKKGMLKAKWPYFDVVAHYFSIKFKQPIERDSESFQDQLDDGAIDDDCEDDMKLLDLKQILHVKPKNECVEANQCRACSNEEASVNVFQEKDEDGLDLAHKLRIIGGVEVEQSDRLPSLICLNCVHELENAYKFRRKCQEVYKQFKESDVTDKIKTEIIIDDNDDAGNDMNDEDDKEEVEALDNHFENISVETNEKKKSVVAERKPKALKSKIESRRMRYDYWKICEICGKNTRNLMSHMDTHSKGKSYSCNQCDKKFKFKSGLLVHKAVHNPTPKKTCEVCGKTFHVVAQYRRHFVYHANERKYSCETCGKRFNTLDILRVHNRIHTDERPFPCQDCGKTFRTAGCVSRHRRIVHRKVKANNSVI